MTCSFVHCSHAVDKPVAVASLLLPLFIVSLLLCSAIFPTSPSHIHPSKWHCKLLWATKFTYICPNSFPCKYLLQWVITLVHGFWFLKHHQYWTIAETHLGCTAATRSSGWSCGWGVLPGCRIRESSRLLHTSMSRRCSRIWPLSRWHNHGACHYACCLWAESRPPSSSPHCRVSSRYCSTFCSMLSAAQDERTWQWLCSHTCCCLASTIFSNFINLLLFQWYCMLSRLILHYLISPQSLRVSRSLLGAVGCWQPLLSWLIIGLLNASCLWICRAVSNRWVWDCSTVVQSFDPEDNEQNP